MHRKKFIIISALFFLSCFCGAFLRFYLLGNVFQSGDNAYLAAKILDGAGILDLIKDYHGFLLNISVSVFAHLVPLLNIPLTEFVWKIPVALVGFLTIPVMGMLACKKYNSSSAIVVMIYLSIMPIHVMMSRFPGGYEIFGALFSFLAIHTYIRFLDQKTKVTGLLASFSIGVYMISHGYFLPFLLVMLGTYWFIEGRLKKNLLETLKFSG